MRQEHRAGEKLFVDFAGQTLPIDPPASAQAGQLFVAVLGASNYTYAEASPPRRCDWIAGHVRAFESSGLHPRSSCPTTCARG